MSRGESWYVTTYELCVDEKMKFNEKIKSISNVCHQVYLELREDKQFKRKCMTPM